MIDVLLGLGSNVGDRKALVDEAVARLARLSGTWIAARSSYYKTEPVGPIHQEWFINIAVQLVMQSDVEMLAEACRKIESALGRDRSVEIPSGPRLIDIDLIAVRRATAADAEPFALRHERFIEHAYTLVPLTEIAANARLGPKTVAEHLLGVDQSGVERLDWPTPTPTAR